MSTVFYCPKLSGSEMPPLLPKLTEATRRVLDVIVEHWRADGRSLTLVEVGAHTGTTKQNVARHVNRLERYGYVRRSTSHYGIIPIYDAEGVIVGDDVRLPHRTADAVDDQRIVEIAEHLCVDAATGETIELTTDVPELGLSAGEILVIDVKVEPKRRDIVAWSDGGRVRVSRYSSKTEPVIGVVRTVIRRVH